MLTMGLCATLACAFLVRGATGLGQLLAGLCLGVFAFGGYLALMPSLTADYYGPKSVGANYGLVFTAFGVSGFLVPKYFAHLVDHAKAAGNIRSGYDEVYLILAGMALACALLSLALRPPRARAAS
jgi:MFS family permease